MATLLPYIIALYYTAVKQVSLRGYVGFGSKGIVKRFGGGQNSLK
jgi:hypothetical protein